MFLEVFLGSEYCLLKKKEKGFRSSSDTFVLSFRNINTNRSVLAYKP